MVTLTINGKEVEAENGKMLLEVIHENNIDTIPTFCFNEQMEPYTSCFICVVEVEGARGLSPACATTAEEGMVVYTRNERVKESRKANLELLLSNHNADCYPPCRLECPANVDVQGYIALASRGLYAEGQKLMRETNAMPMVCG
ncbi:MAG: 2Fe-2S iron-sulfur cluster binding domain-containing protein, partial [bacterium]|nr:2Fe-2S iron-sulfur cluster binding domain-containing protein [bacterium]